MWISYCSPISLSMTRAGNESLKSVGAMQASQIHTWAHVDISLLTDSGHTGLLNRLVGKVLQLGPLPSPRALDYLKVQVWEKVLGGIVGTECEQIQDIALDGVGYNSVDFGEYPCLYPPVALLPNPHVAPLLLELSLTHSCFRCLLLQICHLSCSFLPLFIPLLFLLPPLHLDVSMAALS